MSQGDRPWRNGDLPKAPRNVTPAQAWEKGALAELKASEAADRALDMFQELGGLRRDVGDWMVPIERRLGSLEEGQRITKVALDEIKKILGEKLPALEAEAHEARISSSDLSREVEGMEEALAKIPRIDSVKVRAMIDERYETIVSKEKLAEMQAKVAAAEKAEQDRIAERRADAAARLADKRARKTGLYVALISGIILAIVSGVVTYEATKAASHDTVNAPR